MRWVLFGWLAGCGSGVGGGGSFESATVEACEGLDQPELSVCTTEAFLGALDDGQLADAAYDLSDSVSRTKWSNLPGMDRPGVALGDLDDDQRAIALAVAATLLSDEGYEDVVGILAADDYLGGSAYGSDLARIAVFGTPSVDDDWAVMLGNHHLAVNVTFRAGVAWPTPHHAGVEPKGTFTVGGESYAPLDDDVEAMLAVFEHLSSSELASAWLDGQVFGDVVLGPDEYGTGSLSSVVYPDSEGLLVSSLDADGQDLVTLAIAAWVRTFDDATTDALMADYTSAYDQTRIAFGGESSGPDPEVAGSYLRSDGPRVWIEVAVQNGVVLQGTHHHTIYRDKTFDYGGDL